ncbi:BAQ_1a_G0001840.mRNA.1.CDS.1 [Saccharomyces cerevisiae]|nr:BAQ_1a_G0001840.mRNA.1.CDS.1 [Saccharomyces cerevisiae]CAI4252230.1 BAM_G0001830.mRNA.1.CDS.1 [Saccharomyces cerevisiae]CAI7039380.1 BAM_G0001830.mRNA.1.CDS.1 [Saccharomyces cerevisiae]CAI7040232.1 BAQ_1a_G0001840.mRNA.1.CDS.1 [Saccharomyces cerevisiae]
MQRVRIGQWVYDTEAIHRSDSHECPKRTCGNQTLNPGSIIKEIQYKKYRYILFPPIAANQFTPGCSEYIPILHDAIKD